MAICRWPLSPQKDLQHLDVLHVHSRREMALLRVARLLNKMASKALSLLALLPLMAQIFAIFLTAEYKQALSIFHLIVLFLLTIYATALSLVALLPPANLQKKVLNGGRAEAFRRRRWGTRCSSRRRYGSRAVRRSERGALIIFLADGRRLRNDVAGVQ